MTNSNQPSAGPVAMPSVPASTYIAQGKCPGCTHWMHEAHQCELWARVTPPAVATTLRCDCGTDKADIQTHVGMGEICYAEGCPEHPRGV